MTEYNSPETPSYRPPGYKPNISVIIPHYELHTMLQNLCMPHLYLYGHGLNTEIIVVDNGSKKPLELYGPQKIIRSEERLSFAAACNLGAKEAKADILLFLNNDVQILPAFLGMIFHVLKDPKIAIAGAKLLSADGKLQHVGVVFGKKRLPYHSHYGEEDNPELAGTKEVLAVTGAALAVKKEWFDKTGGFDEAFLGGNYEDIDLCLKAKKDGFKVAIVLSAKAIHLGGATYQFHPEEHTELLVRRNWEILNEKWKDEPDSFFGIDEKTPKTPREESWGL